MLCAPVFIFHNRQLSSFRAPMLWLIDLSVATCQIQFTVLSLCLFFHEKADKTRKYLKPAIFVWHENGRRRLLGAQCINTERTSLVFDTFFVTHAHCFFVFVFCFLAVCAGINSLEEHIKESHVRVKSLEDTKKWVREGAPFKNGVYGTKWKPARIGNRKATRDQYVQVEFEKRIRVEMVRPVSWLFWEVSLGKRQ